MGAPDLLLARQENMTAGALQAGNRNRQNPRDQSASLAKGRARAYLTATARGGTIVFENGTRTHDDHVARAQEGGKPALIRVCGAVEVLWAQA